MARENVEVFMDVWKALDQDVTALSQEVAELCRNQMKPVASIANNYVANPVPELTVSRNNLVKNLEIKFRTIVLDLSKYCKMVRRSYACCMFVFYVHNNLHASCKIILVSDHFLS